MYIIKQGKQPDEAQHKARYVAKGYSQIQEVDYEKTFSPTTRFTSIRMFLQKAASEGMKIYQLDVTGAYINAPINIVIYLQYSNQYN